MWPKLLDMSKDECKRLLRRTELEAYAGIISALRAQGDLTKEKKHLLNELGSTLSISTERHRAEVRRAVNDEKLSTVAERLSGPNNSAEWSIEGRRLIPLMPRLVPQTVFSLTANQAANAAFSHNLTLPLPSETTKKEAPSGNENNGGSVKMSSPSSNLVVLPSVLSIPLKGGPEVDVESSLAKKSRRDSGNTQPVEAGSSSTSSQAMQPASLPASSLLQGPATKPSPVHSMASSRALSAPASKHHAGYTLPASKQHSSKSVVSQMSPGSQASSSVNIKGGYSATQSPLKFTFTKTTTSTGITTPTCSAQKVILVSSSATSFTPSILQRSHSSPSSKSAMVKPGPKQSVILTGLSGQSSGARQTELMASSKQTGQSLRPHAVGLGSVVKQTLPTRMEMTGGQSTAPSTAPALTSLVSTAKKSSAGLSSVNSTVITARTTASVISSHITSYVSPNMAGKPRGRGVSKQKLLKQAAAPPTFSGDPSASKKHMRRQQDAGMKIITQSLSASASKPQRSSGPVNTMDAMQKASMATTTMATGKASNVAGHKVIISTTSAGVTPHHVAMATPLIRTKPSGSVGSRTLTGSTKLVSSGIMGSTGVNNPKLMQTIKATTTSNVSQTMTGVINSKSSLVTHKCFSSSPQTILTEPTKQPQAHNIASTLLQRPRISMVTGVSATTTASTFSPSSIRFPAPHSTSGFTLTTVKTSGAKRMRSPITMVTGPSQAAQKRPLTSAPASPSLGGGITSTSVASTAGKQAPDKAGGVNRGILGSCSHPNSEWIDYDGLLPDTSASSAIKALLEFRSLPDSAKLSQTIDLGLIGSAPSSQPRPPGSQPATQGSPLPPRPPGSQPATQGSPVAPRPPGSQPATQGSSVPPRPPGSQPATQGSPVPPRPPGSQPVTQGSPVPPRPPGSQTATQGSPVPPRPPGSQPATQGSPVPPRVLGSQPATQGRSVPPRVLGSQPATQGSPVAPRLSGSQPATQGSPVPPRPPGSQPATQGSSVPPRTPGSQPTTQGSSVPPRALGSQPATQGSPVPPRPPGSQPATQGSPVPPRVLGSQPATQGSPVPPRPLGSQPATQGRSVPPRPSQSPLRVAQQLPDRTTAGSVLEGFSKFSPSLLSNVQSRLKQALMSERTVKPASAASFLQTATMEVEKALQEQNKALQARQEGSSKQTTPASSAEEPSQSRQPSAGEGKKCQPATDQLLNLTQEGQGVFPERINLSSHDVSSFVDQFEEFIERETCQDKGIRAIRAQQEPGSERTSDTSATSKSVERSPEQSSQVTSRSKVAAVEVISARDWPMVSTNQSQHAEVPSPIWSNQLGLETIHSSGKKGGASVVMESGSVDITQMKIEDFTSQRLQDVEENEEEKEDNLTSSEESPVQNLTAVSPTTSSGVNSGSEEVQGVRISSRKRKAPAPIDDEPGPTSMSSWARAAFNLLQRVMRFRGANRSKGDLNAASWFTRPVAAAEAPGYTNVIKTPMDFGTIKRKLESGQYDDFAGFHGDMMLVHNNCVQYNPPGHEIRRDCEEVFQFYTTEYAKLMERWERPSPKKSKPEDLQVDKSKPAAARSISLK